MEIIAAERTVLEPPKRSQIAEQIGHEPEDHLAITRDDQKGRQLGEDRQPRAYDVIEREHAVAAAEQNRDIK